MKQTILATLLTTALAYEGVDFSSALPESTFACFKSNGMSLVNPRAWHSYGGFDSNVISNVKNARAAGYTTQTVDIYMFPCRGKNAAD